MKWLDWAIVASYLAYVIWDGIRLSKHSKTKEGFFLADRGLPWWAVGLSVMATQMSAITLVGTTGQAYADGMRFIQFYYGLPFAMIILCVTVVPFFSRAKVFTAYEYLERRFDVKVRTLTSFFFLISRGLGVGTIISAPAIVLSIVFGWNLIATIFAIGLSTTLYTMFGGVRAVTWTDVKQMVIILIGLGVVFFVIISSFPAGVTLADGLHLAGSLGKLDMVDTRFDLAEKYTIWSGLIGGLFLALGYFGCDQSQVQRFLTAKSIDQGRTSLLMSAFLKIPLQFFILLIGILVFIFYQYQAPPVLFNSVEAAKIAHTAEYRAVEEKFAAAHAARRDAAIYYDSTNENARAAYLDANRRFSEVRSEAVELVRANGNRTFNDVNYVFPTFILQNMPIGIIGLLIAAIFAAAMSSISSELNALATATTIDFYRRLFRPEGTDPHLILVGRLATFMWGIFACIVAIFATNLGSLIEVVNRFGSFFYGSLLGVFVLAFIVRRANARGAFFGLLFGISSVWIASWFTNIEFLWFNVIGCLVTVAAGYLISLSSSNETRSS
ncbi:MAG TPA: sodium:solute symporter [Pyrinomonadaceae bacterium]|nr:sodium:solute symporter [Pyrinomonadaceae bacterium]